jgi:hypothetical protein
MEVRNIVQNGELREGESHRRQKAQKRKKHPTCPLAPFVLFCGRWFERAAFSALKNKLRLPRAFARWEFLKTTASAR